MSTMEPAGVAASPAAPVALSVDTRAAYGDVFAAHHQRLLRIGYLLTGDRDGAEEAVAETFARVWPHWRRGRVNDDRSYLTRTLVNELNSSGRRRKRRPAIMPDADGDARDDAATGASDATDERLRLLAALAELPARQRAVVVLRYYDDLGEAATAAALGMRIGTVKSQTARGLARLRTILTEVEGQQ